MALVDRLNALLRRVPAWLLYILGAGYAAWYFWLGLSNQLGPEPINTLLRAYGLISLKLIIAGLAITPLRKWTKINLLKFRRAIGVTAFFFLLAHLAVFALLDVQSLSRVWTEVVKRPYVTIGMAGLLLLLPLAVTSNNLSLRKMGGAAWRKLHKLVYPAAILGGVHYVWLIKGWQTKPLVYLAIILILLAARIKWKRNQKRSQVTA
ncbi:protein-methionine-sulfoxide reductase heme-binding subunit MsrQ [Abyssibius alkaniclasticus]|uniref:protein-methionine-sulfoxide reductase heme-binding subunit MsrQ n=1 Tax=Abyssibius alkaniclasticus TaxID=2881234 RepID=UPI00405829D3